MSISKKELKNKTVIVFDLEATCEDRKIAPNYEGEIIEIGAVKILNNEIIDEFNIIIKPSENPRVTKFCEKLTSLTQADVDKGVSFEEGITSFYSWASYESTGCPIYFAWGFYDRNQIWRDCKLNFIEEYAMEENYYSLKEIYREINGLNIPPGMLNALNKEGIERTGTHHRGIDDARNIAKIFIKMDF